jgi:hypothetical protein
LSSNINKFWLVIGSAGIGATISAIFISLIINKPAIVISEIKRDYQILKFLLFTIIIGGIFTYGLGRLFGF